MQFIAQKRRDECGIACVAMILSHLGIPYSYQELRKKSKCESFYEIGALLTTYGVDYLMLELKVGCLAPFPTITLFHYGKRAHFVVLWEKTNQYIKYADPANFFSYCKKREFIYRRGSIYHIVIMTPPNNSINTRQKLYLPYKLRFFMITMFFSFLIYKILLFFAII